MTTSGRGERAKRARRRPAAQRHLWPTAGSDRDCVLEADGIEFMTLQTEQLILTFRTKMRL